MWPYPVMGMIYVCIYVCMLMYVGMYVCMPMYVCVLVCTFICGMFICMYYVCMNAYVCVGECMHVNMYVFVCSYACMYACMFVCMYRMYKLCMFVYLEYRHLIPAPIDRTSASAWFYKHTWMTCQKKQAKHANDPRSSQVKATFSCEVIHASMART